MNGAIYFFCRVRFIQSILKVCACIGSVRATEKPSPRLEMKYVAELGRARRSKAETLDNCNWNRVLKALVVDTIAIQWRGSSNVLPVSGSCKGDPSSNISEL
jgi:hypothetical protein